MLLLQEELEAYDRHQRLLEDNLDSKTAELIHLRRAALEAAAGHAQQVGYSHSLVVSPRGAEVFPPGGRQCA